MCDRFLEQQNRPEKCRFTPREVSQMSKTRLSNAKKCQYEILNWLVVVKQQTWTSKLALVKLQVKFIPLLN